MSPATNTARADAWDAYQSAASPDELSAKLQDMNLPQQIKAKLWDLKNAAQGEVKSSAARDLFNGAGSMAATATAKNAPSIANAVMEFATNPMVAKTGSKAGRMIGAVAPTVGELAAGNPTGAIIAAANAGKTAWAGGKTGYFTGRLAQNAAAPIAKLAETIAPYAEAAAPALSTGTMLALDQTLEPGRVDNQLMASDADMKKLGWSDEKIAKYKKEYPPLLNSIASKLWGIVHGE